MHTSWYINTTGQRSRRAQLDDEAHTQGYRNGYISCGDVIFELASVEKTAMPSVRAPVCPSPPSPPVHPDSPPALPASMLPAWPGVAACCMGDELCNPRLGTAVAAGTSGTLCDEPVLIPYFVFETPDRTKAMALCPRITCRHSEAMITVSRVAEQAKGLWVSTQRRAHTNFYWCKSSLPYNASKQFMETPLFENAPISCASSRLIPPHPPVVYR